jgi:hypothetical protein
MGHIVCNLNRYVGLHVDFLTSPPTDHEADPLLIHLCQPHVEYIFHTDTNNNHQSLCGSRALVNQYAPFTSCPFDELHQIRINGGHMNEDFRIVLA